MYCLLGIIEGAVNFNIAIVLGVAFKRNVELLEVRRIYEHLCARLNACV